MTNRRDIINYANQNCLAMNVDFVHGKYNDLVGDTLAINHFKPGCDDSEYCAYVPGTPQNCKRSDECNNVQGCVCENGGVEFNKKCATADEILTYAKDSDCHTMNTSYVHGQYVNAGGDIADIRGYKPGCPQDNSTTYNKYTEPQCHDQTLCKLSLIHI